MVSKRGLMFEIATRRSASIDNLFLHLLFNTATDENPNRDKMLEMVKEVPMLFLLSLGLILSLKSRTHPTPYNQIVFSRLSYFSQSRFVTLYYQRVHKSQK